ncbi:hypothetical protein NHJ13051_008621 [Beauveria bassiana]
MERPDSSASSSARRPQPAGVKMRACANCSRLKMKCRWPDRASPTDVTTTACTSRVAQLEQKLDGIMSLLESSQRSNRRRPSSTGSASTAGDDASSSPLTPDSHSHNPWPFRTRTLDTTTAAATGGEHTSAAAIPGGGGGGGGGGGDGEKRQGMSAAHADRGSSSSSSAERRVVVELVPGFAVTFAEAAEYLQIYRKDYMPVFPFVVVEETTKPHELHHNAPALFWMIMAAVAQTSEEVDAAVKTWLRHYVAETMMIKQEKTLELLQAILVHLIWGSFHFYIDAETPLFMNLAQNIVLDLKLDWPPEQGQVYKHSLLGAAWCHMNKSHLVRRRKPHTPAEIRAVLGLHYATSVTMSMFRRGPGVTWNSYLTKSCESIAALCQHPLDEALAASVRLQRIAQKGLSALPGTEYVWGPSATVYSHAQEMTLSLTRDNMDKFVHSQTPAIQNDVMFRHLYLALLVRLYEPVLGMQPAVSSSDNSANATARAPFHRTDMLWKLVDACRALFTARAALTDAQTALRPSTMTGFLAFGVVTASRVLFHEAEDWQPSVARRRFDYGAAMRDAAAQYEAAEAWASSAGRRRPMHDRGPLLLLYAKKLRWISQWYEARTVADDLAAAAAAAGGGGGGGGGDGAVVEAAAAMMITPPEDTPGQEVAVDGASLECMDMMATDQQPIQGFLPDFQFDEAFWQDMLLGTPQPAFGQYTMGNGTL